MTRTANDSKDTKDSRDKRNTGPGVILYVFMHVFMSLESLLSLSSLLLVSAARAFFLVAVFNDTDPRRRSWRCAARRRPRSARRSGRRLRLARRRARAGPP